MPPDRTLSAHVSLIAGAAILIGLCEAALMSASLLGARGAFQYVPPRVWVVAPLCWVVLGAALAIVLVPLWPRRGSTATVLTMGLLAMGFRLIHQPLVRKIAGAGVMLIVCAVAVWIARKWLQRPRRTAAAIACAVIVLLTALSIDRPATDARAAAKVPSRAPAAPDVVVVFLDTVSYDAVFTRDGVVDASLPALSGLARQSIVFDRAYSTSSWTLPAHFSAMTGLPAHRLGLGFDDQQYDLSTPTLAQRFRRRGYRTAAVISNTFLNRGSGFDRGFDRFEHAGNALDVCRTAPGALADRYWPWFAATVCNWSASEVTDRALRLLEERERPLFLVLNYMDAHDPYYVERACRAPGFEAPRTVEVSPSEYRGRLYESHLAALRCIDAGLARLFGALEDDAIVAVLADHGEHFGEHGLVRHGNSLRARLLHVPMMIRTTRKEARRVREPVSIAMLPQLLEGHAPSPPSSIVSYLDAAHWSLVRDRWHLIVRDGREELYDLEADPDESTPLRTAPPLEELRMQLRRERTRISREERQRFRSIGYVR